MDSSLIAEIGLLFSRGSAALVSAEREKERDEMREKGDESGKERDCMEKVKQYESKKVREDAEVGHYKTRSYHRAGYGWTE